MRTFVKMIGDLFCAVGALVTTLSHNNVFTNDTIEPAMNFKGIAESNGYSSEEYSVFTEDGYILKLFRIKAGDCGVWAEPPVILMHGFLISSDAWLDAGPKAGLAYLLANECYDVWVGNDRGNYYGRKHTTLNPSKDADFWKFSMDEMGMYDLPAIIDKVLYETGSSQVNYIGYSQGGAAILITLSERPEYQEKVKLYIGLAPAPRMKNSRSKAFACLTEGLQNSQESFAEKGMYEVAARNSYIQTTLETTCDLRLSKAFCLGVLAALDSPHLGSIEDDTLRVLFSHFPAGVSVQTAVKFAQLKQSGDFTKYDYGPEENLKRYGQETAPTFNLKSINTPTVLFTGRNDFIVDMQDVEWLSRQLPNVLEFHVVADPNWNHLDVTYSKYIPNLLFPKINEYLIKYKN